MQLQLGSIFRTRSIGWHNTFKHLRWALSKLLNVYWRILRARRTRVCVWQELVQQTGRYTRIATMQGTDRLTRPVVSRECWSCVMECQCIGDRINNPYHRSVVRPLKYTPLPKPSEMSIFDIGSRKRWIHIIVKWPMEVFVDNSSGISFQQSTNPNTKLRGIHDMREAWVQELRNKFKVKAVKVHTEKNLADMFTKCLAASVRRRLFDEIESISTQMIKNEVEACAS